jgi:hypothetical protein
MNPIFKKMQFKNHRSAVVLNAPESFEPNLLEMQPHTQVLKAFAPETRYEFMLVFVRSCHEIEAIAAQAVQHLTPDGLLWFAYPKKSSKQYKSDIGRDDSWAALGRLGFEGVRMVAIDEDWSALRFRHADLIKSLTRNEKLAMSEAGKARTARA